jgi:hypothetical protein
VLEGSLPQQQENAKLFPDKRKKLVQILRF